jgi:3-hydroxyacyl-CoA dehydrogenase
MKNLLTSIGIFILMSVSPSLAAEKLLTDQQLDAIAAGTVGDGVAQAFAKNTEQTLTNNVVDPQINDANIQNGLDFGNPVAENVVNVPSVNVDNSVDASQNVNSKNDFLILKDFVQENAKAVNIENSVKSQVVNGLNAHVNGLLPSGSSGGSLNNLYQTNIITVNANHL